MKVRILLSDDNSIISRFGSDSNPSDFTPDTITDTPTTTIFDDYTPPEATFTLVPSIPDSYKYSRYAYPCVPISFSVPDSDISLVESWVNSSIPDSAVASDTLTKRITEKVLGAYRTYISDCSAVGIFTAPCRIGMALRLNDGSLISLGAPRNVYAEMRAPLMRVREASLAGSTFSAITEFINTPAILHVSLPDLALSAPQLASTHSLLFYATRQVDLLTGTETVDGIRTYSIFGENARCWHYPRLNEDQITEKLLADSSFRIIAKIPIADCGSGLTSFRLPADSLNLNAWNDYPPLKDDDSADPGDNTGTEKYTHIRLVTSPLDLGMPERTKHVSGLSIRGIFPRYSDNEISVTLFGSHHRDNWHRIAAARGPHIRLLRTVCYRWFMVEITAPKSAILEAITFSIR